MHRFLVNNHQSRWISIALGELLTKFGQLYLNNLNFWRTEIRSIIIQCSKNKKSVQCVYDPSYYTFFVVFLLYRAPAPLRKLRCPLSCFHNKLLLPRESFFEANWSLEKTMKSIQPNYSLDENSPNREKLLRTLFSPSPELAEVSFITFSLIRKRFNATIFSTSRYPTKLQTIDIVLAIVCAMTETSPSSGAKMQSWDLPNCCYKSRK